MPLEPRSYFCAGRLLAAETPEDVDPSTYFTYGAETPASCPNCRLDLAEFASTLPQTHRSNLNCPNCGYLILQQRVTCNWDLTPIFEVMPYDGQTYLIRCPNPACGNIIRANWPPGVNYGPPSDPPSGYDPTQYVELYTP